MNQFVCLFEAYGNRQWFKSLPGETLEEFKKNIISNWGEHRVYEFYELSSAN